MVTRVPRFLFSELSRPRSGEADGSPAVGWRLVAPNNRELGRTAELVEDFTTCREAVLKLQVSLGQTRSSLWFDDDAQWRWELLLDEEPAAVCSRPYWRRVECEYGLGQFLTNAKVATVVDDLRTIRRPRRWLRPEGRT